MVSIISHQKQLQRECIDKADGSMIALKGKVFKGLVTHNFRSLIYVHSFAGAHLCTRDRHCENEVFAQEHTCNTMSMTSAGGLFQKIRALFIKPPVLQLYSIHIHVL